MRFKWKKIRFRIRAAQNERTLIYCPGFSNLVFGEFWIIWNYCEAQADNVKIWREILKSKLLLKSTEKLESNSFAFLSDLQILNQFLSLHQTHVHHPHQYCLIKFRFSEKVTKKSQFTKFWLDLNFTKLKSNICGLLRKPVWQRLVLVNNNLNGWIPTLFQFQWRDGCWISSFETCVSNPGFMKQYPR